MNSIFDLLLRIPPFQGVSLATLERIIGNVKFDFRKYSHGEVVVRTGEACDSLIIVLSGDARAVRTFPERNLTVGQTLSAPAVIAPEHLFGLSTEAPYTLMALTPLSVLRIPKADYVRILSTDPIFLFNYLNLLSLKAQAASASDCFAYNLPAAERIMHTIRGLELPGGTDFTLAVREGTLAGVFALEGAEFRRAAESLLIRKLVRSYTMTELNV